MLNLGNFVQTTLAAPAAPGALSLQLVDVSGLNFPAGDYCYLTLIDGATVEIVKYTSGGTIVNNTIPVTRGQDGTTAKSFPVGACVKEAWNVQQLKDLVNAVYNTLFNTSALPANTQEVIAVPVAPPAGSVIYSVWVAEKRVWYWDINAPGWVELGNSRDGVIVSNTVPVTAPNGNVAWCVVTSSASLYYWTGSAWLQIGGTGGTGRETWTRGSDPTGTVGGPAGASSTISDLALTYLDQVKWRENPALASCLTQNPDKSFTVGKDAMIRVTASLGIGCPTPVGANSGTLAIVTDMDGGRVFDDSFSSRAGQSQSNLSMAVVSPAFKITAGKKVDATIIFDGTNAQTMTLSAALLSIEILALL